GPITLGPGASADLPVSLTNLAQSEIGGGVTAISPFGTWADAVTIGPRAQPFRLAADGTTTVPVTVRAGHTARPGAHWWVLVRVGRAPRVLLDRDRPRLRAHARRSPPGRATGGGGGEGGASPAAARGGVGGRGRGGGGVGRRGGRGPGGRQEGGPL